MGDSILTGHLEVKSFLCNKEHYDSSPRLLKLACPLRPITK